MLPWPASSRATLVLFSLYAFALSQASASNDLRRATHSNQATIHHDPLTNVWDRTTGQLRPHAARMIDSRWRSTEHSSVRATDKRSIISDVLNWKDDDGWGIAIAQLENYHQDNEWLAEFGIGTPPQDLKIVLDTGSAGGWVYSPACCYASNHSSFDPSHSSTYSNRTVVNGTAVRGDGPGTPWNSTYGGAGNGVAGYLGYDSFEFANDAIKVQNATTALVTHITGDPNSRIGRKMEGLIGLMPARVIDSDIPGGNWTSPIEQALRQHRLKNPYLAATFVKARRRTGRGGGGRYTFGGVDHAALRGDLTWINATSSTYWGLSFDNLTYGQDVSIKDPSDTYHRAIVDTGTALILLSPNATDQVNSQISGSHKRTDSKTNPWLIPCKTGLPEYEARLPQANRTQPFYISLGGRQFGIPIEDFPFWPLEPVTVSNGTNKTDMCLSAFQPSTAAFTVIGDVFFKNHAVVFDFGKRKETISA